jgi:predicted PurR-regulated permease PerM
LFVKGLIVPAIGITVFGILSSIIDNFVRPFLVSQRTRMHPAVVLVGMIGGFLMFGFLGFILGPLILAYLLIILEIYRNKHIPGVFLQKD